MNTLVWIIQWITAILFAIAGSIKITQPKDKLKKSLPWTSHFPLSTVKVIGTSELLGAIGLIIPQITGILPVLSPIAAIGLSLLMVFAASHHLPRNEYKEAIFNAVLFILTGMVALYRF